MKQAFKTKTGKHGEISDDSSLQLSNGKYINQALNIIGAGKIIFFKKSPFQYRNYLGNKAQSIDLHHSDKEQRKLFG